MMFIDFFTTKSYHKWLFNSKKLIQIREFTEINTQISISKGGYSNSSFEHLN